MHISVADLEANGLLPEATVVWCGVFKNIKTNEVTRFEPTQIRQMLRFMDTIDVLIMHNGLGYDWPLLKKLHNYEYTGKKVDTLIMSRLQSPNRPRPWGLKGKAGPHSVEAWGYRFGRAKPEHEDWSQYSPEMLHRCSEDVEIQHLIYKFLIDEARGYEWKNAWKMNFKLFEILQKQEDYGWLVDQDHLHKSIAVLDKWMNRIAVKLQPRLPDVMEVKESKVKGVIGWVKKPFLRSGRPNRHMVKYWGEDTNLIAGPHSRVVFRKVSLDKNKEVKGYLLELGWIPKEWNTNDDGQRTSPKLNKDDPFDGIQGSVGKLIAKRVQCKQRKGILEGWLDRLRPDGRLPSVVTGLAATGRAKHSIIVNVPNCDNFFGKWMRKVFTCPEGKVLIGCDAGGCQDRMLANRAENQQFTDMLLHGDKKLGTDGHSLAMKAVNIVHRLYGIKEVVRGKAKNYNFGWKFGASDNKLGKMGGGGEREGAAIRVELERVFPAQAALIVKLTEEWKANAKVEEHWGKKRYKNGWIRGLDGRPIFIESEHAILVYMLQSDEAITMAAAYIILYKRLINKGYVWGKDWAYVCWYHDEYTIECNEEYADDIKVMAEQAIADAGAFFKLDHCPQVGDAEVGKNWYDIH
jgi:DNA polymerase-1